MDDEAFKSGLITVIAFVLIWAGFAGFNKRDLEG